MNPASSSVQQDPPPPGLHPRLGYLLSIYPAISHTFFLNEIAGLRKLGLTIDVASINKPEWAAGGASELETSEFGTTFYIKGMPAVRIFRILLNIMFTKPDVIFR